MRETESGQTPLPKMWKKWQLAECFENLLCLSKLGASSILVLCFWGKR